MTNVDLELDFNKSVGYLNKGNYKKASTLLRKCLNQFEFKEAYLNLGNCYRGLGQDSKMIECYKKAANPKTPYLNGSLGEYNSALNNLGLAYYMIGDDDSAIECYEKAISLDPNFWDAWWNCSTAVLRQASSGRTELFKDGWEMYDARFLKTPPIKLKNTKESLVYWDKVSSGDSIIVLAEQGIGDNIMWGRYLSLLAKKFSKVYVQCDKSLEPIFSDYIPVRDARECDAELAIPMCTLSKCFDPIIPAGDWLRGKFSSFSFPESERLNVGIVWAGSNTHANDHNRSVAIHRFHRLSAYANLYSLSPGFKSTKYVTGLDIGSWKDTAEYINGLDLIITVDTSVAHMCGSLGCKTWLLQPSKETDFRWGNNVSKSVWYDSIRIFNNPGSWEFVFDQVEEALREELYL